jgi:HlyD family secretion protein
VKVFLSESTQALLIPNGPFTGVTGGRWIYVVSADGSRAEKRDISIGRKNAGYIEVLGGLKPGEKVVVSEYDTFKDANGLQIQN